MPQMGSQLIRRADAVIGAGRRQRMPRFFEIGPDIGASRFVLAEDVMMRKAVAEKPQAVFAAAAGFHFVRVYREARHHRDVGIDRVADRHAFLLENPVIVIDPLPGFAGIDEGEGQRADAVTRGHLDGLAIGAGDPEWRVWLLHWLWHHIAARHLEELALEAGVGVHHHHVGALLDALMPHPPLLDRVEADIEAAELHQRRALAGAEFDAAVGDEIERGDALGHPRRVIVFRWHQADAVAETDVFGALRAGRKEYFRGGGVRILLEKMVLDFPGIVDAELVGEFDLIERLLKQPVLVALVPRPRKLVFVENAEFHGRSLGAYAAKACPVLRTEYA